LLHIIGEAFMKKERPVDLLISYIALRRIIGILGIGLPYICILFGYVFDSYCVQRSISFYYHTNVQDLFIGLMVTVSLFLITYKGYDFIDNLVSTLSGICGLGLALFPCKEYETSIGLIGVFQINQQKSDMMHITFAALFFLLLAINSIFLFTKSKRKTRKTKQKIWRNRIYIFCGCFIIAMMILLLILLNVLSETIRNKYFIVLIIEAFMLGAFGVSWLIKGETILKDKKLRKV
jgi:hypothetical protein